MLLNNVCTTSITEDCVSFEASLVFLIFIKLRGTGSAYSFYLFMSFKTYGSFLFN